MLEKESIYCLRTRKVKRILWPVDHEKIISDLKNEEIRIKKEFTEKYNFDFDTEKPMHGKYNWVSIGSETYNENSFIKEDPPCCSKVENNDKLKTTSKKRRDKSKNSMTVPKKKRISPSSMTLRRGIRKRQART